MAIPLQGGSPEEQLQPFLRVKPPEGSFNTPPSLSFERKRELEIAWSRILGSAPTRGDTSIGAIRNYFENSWGLKPDEKLDEARFETLFSGTEPLIRSIDTGEIKDDKPVLLPVYRPKFDEPEGPAEEQVTQGMIIQHGSSGRWYLVVSQDQPLTQADFATPQVYYDSWENKVDGVEMIFTKSGEASQYLSEFSEIDLRPAVIHRAFNELLQQQAFAKSVSENVDKVTNPAIEQIIQSGMNTEELENLQERVFRLKLNQYAVDRRLKQLQSQAADLGFYLFLRQQEFTFPDGRKKTVKPGEIYTQYRRTARWSTSHSRKVRKGIKILGFIPSSKLVTKRYKVPHSRIVTDYTLVDTSHDPVTSKMISLRQEGMNVFQFERGTEGFVTPDGTLLRTVMEQCERNETFRRKCVVLLPIIEESLTGKQVLTKYSVFTRPLPGIAPNTLPRLIVKESLSYRTAWRESHLGELVSTINLAPGEERTVVVTKTFEQETSVTRSATSIFDVSRSESNDLASEMEDQARSESERSSNMQFSSSASASYGVLTADASASGGSSTSLKDFSQAISKVARKASQSLNQQNREEVSSSSSSKTTVSNKDQTTATIKNINQGRTLNLLFYRLLNKFEGGIYVDELQFEVIPSIESIAGSGVYESLRFGLGDLQAMIKEFQLAHLPFSTEIDQSAYQEQIVENLESLLRDEYRTEEDTSAEDRRQNNSPVSSPSMRSACVLSHAHQPDRLSAKLATGELSKLEQLARDLREMTLDSQQPIQQDNLLLPSGGLYMDTVVGSLPATEPYSEAMRTEEVNLRAADVLVKRADAQYKHAMAQRIGSGSLTTSNNWLTGIYADTVHRTLALRLKSPLPGGQWDILIDGSEAARLDQGMFGKRDISYTWEFTPDWLDSDDLIYRVMLMENDTGDTIRFSG